MCHRCCLPDMFCLQAPAGSDLQTPLNSWKGKRDSVQPRLTLVLNDCCIQKRVLWSFDSTQWKLTNSSQRRHICNILKNLKRYSAITCTGFKWNVGMFKLMVWPANTSKCDDFQHMDVCIQGILTEQGFLTETGNNTIFFSVCFTPLFKIDL